MTTKKDFKFLSLRLNGDLHHRFEELFEKSPFSSRTEYVRSLINDEYSRRQKDRLKNERAV